MNTTNKELISQFKLPGYIAGKSFADASKLINNRFEGRNDITSKNTKKELLNRLAQAQEYLKAQHEESTLPQESMSMMPQQQMAFGGFDESVIGKGFQEDATGAEQSAAIGAGIGTLTSAIDLGRLAFGKPQQDTSGNMASEKVDTAGMIGGSALKGASAGAALGPVGAGVGAVVGGVAGLLGAGKAKKAALENSNNFAFKQNRQFSDNYAMGGPIDPTIIDPNAQAIVNATGIANIPNQKDTTVMSYNTKPIVKYQPGVTEGKTGKSGFYLYSKLPTEAGFNPKTDREFVYNSNMPFVQKSHQWQKFAKNGMHAMGGKLNQYKEGGKFKPQIYMDDINPESTLNMQYSKLTEPNIQKDLQITEGTNPLQQGDTKEMQSYYDASKLKDKTFAGKTLKFLGENYGNALRYTPALMNAIQLAKLKKPEGVVLDRLGNRYKPTYTDLAQQQNIVNQELNNVNSAIQQSGASQGASRAALLGSQLNKTRALSNAYAQAQAQNAQQDAIAQQFNLGVDQANLQQSNLQQDINDRNMGNYDTQKSKLMSQIGTDIGNIGKEQLFKQYPKMMGLGYNWNGKYFVNEKGDIKTKEEAAALESNKSANGGYLNKDVLNYINTMYMKRNKK